MADDIEVREFEKGEVRSFGHGRLELLHIGDRDVGRLVAEPGWRWTTDLRPIVGTDLCMASHFIYEVSGTMRIVMADGTEFDVRPGQLAVIPPGHDAFVVGNESAVAIDYEGATNYALRDTRTTRR